MRNSRQEILNLVRNAICPDHANEAAQIAEANRRLARPRPNLIPARAQLSSRGQQSLFAEMAESVSSTVVRLAAISHIPTAVARFLAKHNLPSRLKVSRDPTLTPVVWQSQPSLEISTGVAEQADIASLTVAAAGIAETGTLVMLSGQENPTINNFLSENHLVVLPAENVVGSYEDFWEKIRGNSSDGLFMPRTVNWITGPSRSGDIEQQIQLGVHGPRRLHILMIEGGDG